MSLRQSIRRGVSAAVHTDAPILSAAAVSEFLSYVQKLVAEGDGDTALALWCSVVEIVHLPPPPGNILEIPGFPPMLRIGCADTECRRCAEQRGGFRFPWIGCWTRRGTLVRPEATPAEAWSEHSRQEDTLDLLLVETYASGWRLSDLVPPQWRRIMELLGPGDVPGSATTEDALGCWRAWQQGHVCWMDPNVSLPSRSAAVQNPRSRAQRTLAMWMDHLLEDDGTMLAAPCLVCGTPSRRVCSGCFLPQCQWCHAAGDQGDCCDEARLDERYFYEVPAMQQGQSRLDLLRRLVRGYATTQAARQQPMDTGLHP